VISPWIIEYLRKQQEDKQKELEDNRPALYIEEDDRPLPKKEKEETSKVIIIQL
jgi:hypothetical protein